MKLYEVLAKCGHVGKHHYVIKHFAVKAETKKDAAALVRFFPRVKHHHKDAIKNVIEIDETRFKEILNNNAYDPYFACSNVQEQRLYVEENIYDEELDVKDEKIVATKPFYYGKLLLRNPKKYMSYNQIYKNARYAV